MPLLLNDLRPRYPRPRPLTLREEWAALRARLDTVAECLEKPTSLRRRYAICQARYEALLAGEEPPPPPPLDPAVCALCGAVVGEPAAPAAEPAPAAEVVSQAEATVESAAEAARRRRNK